MKGKVNCTCGWSWNKSDSSKKDMYICHECGRDNSNNMKNGGWLDSIPQAQGGTEIDWDKVRSVNDNLGVQAAKMFDPTGISSYPDVYYAAKDLAEGKGSWTDLGLNVLGALPMIGKAKTVFHLARASRATDKVKKAKKVLNAVEKVAGKANDFVNYPISKLKPLANSNKIVPKVIGTTAKKVERIAENMGKPLSPKGQRISTKQITKSDIKNLGVNLLDTANVTRDVTNVAGQAIDEAKQILETPSLIDKTKTIRYYNTDPKRGEVEKPGQLADVQYIPISNSAQLSKWNQQGNLKNGGWLDNYNDSQASAPEGMVGDGFSNVGRNYSPAWGGQFEEGGEIPNAQKGKKVKYVESKNDPRYKAYNDSLNSYNTGNKVLNKLKTILENNQKGISGYENENNNYSYATTDYIKNPYKKPDYGSNKKGTSPKGQGKDLEKWIKKELDPVNWKSQLPIAEALKELDKNNVLPFRSISSAELPTISIYKKPEEEVIVQRPQEQLIQNNLQPIGIQNDFNIESPLPEIRQQVKQPKYYDIQENINQPFGGSQTNYRTSDLNSITSPDDLGPGNTRKIVPHYAMGGSIPGSVGFTYARTKGIPSEGPYAKKTMPSAQNGKEMQYYREGLDFQPKTISKNGGWLNSYEDGGIIKDDRGQWDHPGEITEIGSNEITMQGVPYDVLGVSDTGDTKLMKPGKDYKFKGKKVTEFPMAKNGLRQEQKGLQNLDNLTNFTNYNKPQPGSWLNKYN